MVITSWVASLLFTTVILSVAAQGQNGAGRGTTRKTGITPVTPVQCDAVRHPDNPHKFIQVSEGGGETDMDCHPNSLWFYNDLCYCSWSPATVKHQQDCTNEYSPLVGNTEDDLVAEYRRWDALVPDSFFEVPDDEDIPEEHWQTLSCDRLLPPCAAGLGLMYFNYTNCWCYYSDKFLEHPELVYCAPRIVCRPGVRMSVEHGIISNDVGVYIENIEDEDENEDEDDDDDDDDSGSLEMGNFTMLPLEDGDNGGYALGKNYIRDAFLSGNSGRDISIHIDVWLFNVEGTFTLCSDGCVDETGSQIPERFLIQLRVSSNRIEVFGKIEDVEFSCEPVNIGWISVWFSFCDGVVHVSVKIGTAAGDMLSCNVDGEVLDKIMTFTTCPFLIGNDPFFPSRKLRGEFRNFEVDKDCNEECTPAE